MSILRFLRFIQRVIISPFFLAIILVMPISVQAEDSAERMVTGQWRFTAALDAADVASLDEREAAQLIGRVFTISKEQVKFGDRDCGSTNFEMLKVEPTLHLRQEFHADAHGLRLPNPVTVVHLDCTSVFIRNPNKVVIFWQGWFFDAVRVRK